MGRKKGSKNGDSEVKSHQVAQKVLNEGKTVAKAAEEIGIHPNTASRLLHRAMADDEVRSRIQRSKDRVLKMLSLADQTFLRILSYNKPENFGNQLKAATSIYRTMGVLADEPLIKVTHVTPIRVEVENRTYNIGSGDSPKASS